MRMPNVVSREEWQAIVDRLPSAPALPNNLPEVDHLLRWVWPGCGNGGESSTSTPSTVTSRNTLRHIRRKETINVTTWMNTNWQFRACFRRLRTGFESP
jgi:hypothetical protein